MANELIRFEWQVYEGGYRTILGDRLNGGTVDEAVIESLSEEARYRRYAPLTGQTGLFRTFAATPLTRAGITNFARTYGLLGVDVHYRTFDDDDPRYEMGGNAEPLDRWWDAITLLKAMVGLWDVLRVRRVAEDRLREAVLAIPYRDGVFEEYRLPPVVHGPHPSGGLQDPADEASAQFCEDFEQERWRPVGWYLLEQTVRSYLREHTSPSVAVRPEGDGLSLAITPRNLLGAVWLQFAQAVSGNLQHRICQESSCGQWFEVSTRQHGRKTNCQFCSVACRMKTHRRRQVQARRLAADGMSVEDIAKSLDSSASTVRGWIGPGLRVVR